jgi:hypothetical protein
VQDGCFRAMRSPEPSPRRHQRCPLHRLPSPANPLCAMLQGRRTAAGQPGKSPSPPGPEP